MSAKSKICLVYYSGSLDSTLLENISSNYPHKKLHNNAILVYTDESSKTVFEKIAANVPQSNFVVVIDLNDYWGVFPTDVLEWMKTKTPQIIVGDPNKTKK